jgi:hypothetical protein
VAKEKSEDTGLHTPLSMPRMPWEDVLMDFSLGLPRTHSRFDWAFVVVDKLFKMAHFLPCKRPTDGSFCTELFFKDIVRMYRLHKTFTSDSNTKFLGHFWRTLLNKLGTGLQNSSVYHLQTNGQIEAVNKSLRNIVNFLRFVAGNMPKQWN